MKFNNKKFKILKKKITLSFHHWLLLSTAQNKTVIITIKKFIRNLFTNRPLCNQVLGIKHVVQKLSNYN